MTSLSSPLLKIKIRFISFSDSIKAFHSYRPGFDVHSSVERYFPNCCDVWRFEENQSLRQARLSSRLWGWRSKSGSDAAGQATLELLQPQNHLPSHPNHLLPTKNSGPNYLLLHSWQHCTLYVISCTLYGIYVCMLLEGPIEPCCDWVAEMNFNR